MKLVELGELRDSAMVLIHPARIWSEGGYESLATDTPAYQQWDARVKRTPVWTRGGAAEWMESAQLGGTGAVELENGDGKLDFLFGETIKGRTIKIWNVREGESIASRVLLHWLQADRIELADELVLTLFCTGTSARLDVPLTTLKHSGTGTALDGQPLPYCIGTCLNVPAQLVDTALLKYRVHATDVFEITNVRDNGDLLAPGTDWTAISGGFQLLLAPVGKITADVKGQKLGALTWVKSLIEFVAHLCTDIALLPYARIDNITLTDIEDDVGSNEYGLWVTDGGSVRDALTRLMHSIGGWWHETSDGKIGFARLKRPTEILNGPFVINYDNLTKRMFRVINDRAPNFSATVLAQRNWHVHGTSDLATSLLATSIGVTLQQDYRVTRSPVSATIGIGIDREAKLPVAGKAGLPTLIADATLAQSEANHRGDLYKGAAPLLITFDVLIDTLTQVVESGMAALVVIPRLGLNDPGGLAQVLTIAQGEFSDSLQITVRIEAQ